MLLKIFTLAIILQVCYAPPVSKNKEETQESQTEGLEDYIEYHRYIREVVNALESDPTFREKLEKANEEDIRSGKIAHELELVSHHVRTKLDEIKRTELQRLRDLTAKKMELMENNSIEDPTHHHLDHENQHTFEIEDLKRLIAKTTEDLAEADRKRREEFKEYELQKEYERRAKLNETQGDERDKLEKEYKDLEEKHKKHGKLHTPGHKQQLEEVWEEQDHMQQDFNPKTFFMLHDLDANGLWDQDEVKALFVKELDKMYAEGAPEDDMRERVEEMERMRESVFKEIDTNRDGFIDFQEFLAQTKRNDYEKDNGWQGLDEQKQFTDEELDEYIRQHQMRYPPPPGYHPGAYPPQQGYPPYQGMPPQQPGMQPVPPGHYPPQGAPMQQHPGQMHPSQYQHGQFNPGQMPQAQVHPQQMQGGNYPNLNTNEVYPGNQPPQQYHQQQMNQQQQPPPANQQYKQPQANQQQQPPQANQQQQYKQPVNPPQQPPQANQQQQANPPPQPPQPNQQQQYNQQGNPPAQPPQANQQQYNPPQQQQLNQNNPPVHQEQQPQHPNEIPQVQKV